MKQDAFTLVEVLVATTIVVVLTLLLAVSTHQTAEAENLARSSADEFRMEVPSEIRKGSRGPQKPEKIPRGFQFTSDLRFVCGPMQAGRAPLDRTEEGVGEFAAKRPGHGVFFQALLGRLQLTTTARR